MRYSPGRIYSLALHDDALADLDGIYKEDECAAADIEVFLEEAKNNQETLDSLTRKGFVQIDDLVRTRESNPHYASALVRARQRLATQVEGAAQKTTAASLRLKAGFSQAKVAELLGNSQSSYSLIESGRRADILHSRDELAAALKNTQEKAS